MSARKNPCTELDISPAEMKKLTAKFQRDLAGQGAGLRRAAALYTKFTGHKELEISKVKIPDMPKELVEIGTIDGILYTTVRDGVTEKYIHRFKAKSRPLFAVSPDGKQLFLLGGAFTFGDRGIVDT
jgi:hypothetical protein